MSKIAQFNRDTVRSLHEELADHLAAFAAERGLKVKRTNCKFATSEMPIGLALVVDAGNGVPSGIEAGCVQRTAARKSRALKLTEAGWKVATGEWANIKVGK